MEPVPRLLRFRFSRTRSLGFGGWSLLFFLLGAHSVVLFWGFVAPQTQTRTTHTEGVLNQMRHRVLWKGNVQIYLLLLKASYFLSSTSFECISRACRRDIFCLQSVHYWLYSAFQPSHPPNPLAVHFPIGSFSTCNCQMFPRKRGIADILASYLHS